ncbi:hypothetical protein IEO21_05941 [Rhodonia placenta]|uniref:DUF6699 domain-containing protein n=1 Tax=Rhodonia placenta TaxID=104341 RepID=A0A8H7U1L6_9APHY|nr:hypothetical protein IEO21_05941 [Postia placenta]
MTIMPSYLRNLFGGSNASSPAGTSKSHSRSRSAGPAPANIYAPRGSMDSGANVPRNYSYTSQATNPSPLRYPTDTRTLHGYGRRAAATPYAEPRAHVIRRASYKAREPANYAMHTPSAKYTTPPSSRSNSSSSLYGMGVPRTPSSDAGHYGSSSDRRPPFRHNQSWQPGSSAGSTSSYGSVRGHSPVPSGSHSRPRTPCLHMHPLLAHTRLHHAPLNYDVVFTPSARTVLDRATHSPIPSHTLSQPATEPPMPAGARLVLRSHKFPWPVVVTSPSAGSASPGPRFTVGPPTHARSASGGSISNLDVLYAVHTTLMTQITPEEWEALGRGSRAQQKVTRAYERRCTRMGGGWEGGVRRVDWLGEKTRLVGVEVDKSGGGGGSGKLVFARA